MIRVTDILQSVTSSDVAALQQIEIAKAELRAAQADFESKVETDLATIEDNMKRAVNDAAAALGAVETARAGLAEDVKALTKEAKDNQATLRAQLLATTKAIVKGAGADKQWAVAIINESSATLLERFDAIMADHDALIGWVEPKPVDAKAIADVIAKDLKTLVKEKDAD